MLPYESFFYGGVFFLTGVAVASVGIAPFFVTISALLLSVLFLLFYLVDRRAKNIWFAGLSLLLTIGSAYYRIDDARFRAARIPFGKQIEVLGVVESDPVRKGSMQEITAMISKPFQARIFVKLDAHQRFSYADMVQGAAVIERPTSEGYARYLEGAYIRGIADFPTLKKVGEGRGSRIRSFLFGIRHRITETFARILPSEEATFLSGLTIGARGEFSPELSDAMQKSGTTHLVALSGYNISILVYVVMSTLLFFMPRRAALVVATHVIIGFVMMTGAESSVVRAAIIGFIILASFEIGRVRDFRNIILASCLLMVLLSPKVLVFDIGFQLSFLSLLGIVYIGPLLMHAFGVKEGENAGFLSWKTSAIATLSAQLATLPILIGSFGYFSPISLFSNIAILEFIPITMGMGFLMAFVAPLSHYGALIFGLIAAVFLKLELYLIYFFARISIPIHLTMSVLLSFAYYSALLWWIYANKKIPQRVRDGNTSPNVRDV